MTSLWRHVASCVNVFTVLKRQWQFIKSCQISNPYLLKWLNYSGQVESSPSHACVCYPKDPIWNRVNSFFTQLLTQNCGSCEKFCPRNGCMSMICHLLNVTPQIWIRNLLKFTFLLFHLHLASFPFRFSHLWRSSKTGVSLPAIK